MAVPDYCAQPSLQYAKQRIKNPPLSVVGKKGDVVNKHLEHHVGSWACTMVSKVFNEDHWIITPEKRDKDSKKRPDIVVEYVNKESDSTYHMIMELKAADGERLEKALHQSVNNIAVTMEADIEVYVVVQRGTKIAFFEYHNDISNLDEEDIPHFKGCISLTQDYEIQGQLASVMANKPNNLEHLYHDYKRLRKTTEVREEAAKYDIPCVFDLDQHPLEINFLFHHMANNFPRSSV